MSRVSTTSPMKRATVLPVRRTLNPPGHSGRATLLVARLPDDLREQALAAAAASNMSISEFTRNALTQFLARSA